MRAVVMRNQRLVIDTLADPEPGPGEVLVKTLACGICGSDLHALKHAEKMVEVARRSGGTFIPDLSRDMVMGHEFCAEIVDYGPKTERKYTAGTVVTSSPVVFGAHGIAGVGLSNDYPGGFGEYMLLSEALVRPVPEAIGARLAALTEPVSVGVYYVRAAEMREKDVPLVIGCGAIGLAVIAALRRTGAHPILAADLSAQRREQALQNGADRAIDPRAESPYAMQPGAKCPANVIFECVGLPGVLDGVTRGAPHGARVMVAGWCLETDRIFTPIAHFKGLTIKFGGGPTPADFDVALRALGDGEIDIEPWISHEAGLDGVADAFDRLGDPTTGLRTLIWPGRG